MYELELTERFKTKYRKLAKNNSQLTEKISIIFDRLRKDPFQKNLKTHKVHVSQLGEVFSSRVTGDLRVLWSVKNNVCTLMLLDIGGHSGKRSVYG